MEEKICKYCGKQPENADELEKWYEVYGVYICPDCAGDERENEYDPEDPDHERDIKEDF